jgi:peptide deformylase
VTVRPIVTTPDPVLRAKAKKVQQITPEITQLIDDMIETMREAPGVGLAAPQLGVSQRVIVVEYPEGSEDPEAEPKPPKLYAVVNPEISRHSRDVEIRREGCLSIPDYMGDVERYTQATVKGLDRHGKPFKLKTKNWLSRVFQHEIDHLDGILYTDRATKLYKLEPDDEQQRPAPV